MDPSDSEDTEVNASSSTIKETGAEYLNKLEENFTKEKDEFISKNVNVEKFIDNEIKSSKIENSNDMKNNDGSSNKVIKESKINNRRKEDKLNKQSSNKEAKQNTGVKRLGSKLGAKLNQSVENEDSKSQTKNLIHEESVGNSEKLDSSKNVEVTPSPKNLDKNSDLNNSQSKNSSDKSMEETNEKRNEESFPADGWELEDGFEVPTDFASKPKDEEFEKELFPVLNKLSSLSTTNNVESPKESQIGGSAGNSWGGWGGWGSSLLSTATESVSTLTSHVSAGLNTVFETGLGAPDPELLAETFEKEEKEKAEKEKEVEESTESANGNPNPAGSVMGFGEGFSQLFSGVSILSSKVINEGLDTLETLGKKTMEVLQEGDPGLRKKRALFFQDDDRPVLSQVLREAKEVAEHSDKLEEEKQAARKVHFETLFDDYHGLVHLEALEMLSKQCQLKIHTILLSMSGDALKDLRETLDQVKELCELSDEEDEESDKDDEDSDSEFSKKIADAIQMMGVKVPHSKLIEVSEGVSNWLASETAKNAKPSEIHEKAVSSMAEFTSVSMETFHRMAELLLIKQRHSTADEAESLTQLTGALCARVSRMATKYTLLLSENDDNKSNNPIITTIFMESANSSSYIQDACRLLIPVLQVGAST